MITCSSTTSTKDFIFSRFFLNKLHRLVLSRVKTVLTTNHGTKLYFFDIVVLTIAHDLFFTTKFCCSDTFGFSSGSCWSKNLHLHQTFIIGLKKILSKKKFSCRHLVADGRNVIGSRNVIHQMHVAPTENHLKCCDLPLRICNCSPVQVSRKSAVHIHNFTAYKMQNAY